MNNETTRDTLHITLLGNPGMTRQNAPVTSLAYSRAVALVYYLAATGRFHTREVLAGLFWAETSDEQARKNLRDVLADLRRVLAPYLTISRQTVGLNAAAPIHIDSQHFEDHLAAARTSVNADDAALALQAAVALYQGDFLAGLYVAQAPAFEEWMLAERTRFRQLALHALHTLVSHSVEHGRYLDGIDMATRLLTLDPLREESHRQMMTLLERSGQRSAAIAQYGTLVRLLADELGIQPTDETRDLYAQIVAETIRPQAGSTVLRVAARPLHNLPAPLTRFVGRVDEVAHLLDRLSSATTRLLTIVGPGGVGKTTLALHVANQLVATGLANTAFVHGVFFVPLASLHPTPCSDQADAQATRANDLAARIGHALGFTFAGADDPFTQIRTYLRAKNLLLILDNFEHLLDATDMIVQLLQHAPALSLLITSRIRLHIRGEQIVDLDGLPVPSAQELAVPSILDRYDALLFFRQTAEAVHPRLTWTRDEQAAAARVCQLVDGLPLGIELAASLVRLMPVAEIAHALEQTLNILADTRRDMPDRHQSLRAVFDHSWHLLSPKEQRVLRRLVVFRNGFTQQAAAYVCTDQADAATSDPCDTLAGFASTGSFLALFAALVDSSLIHRAIAEAPDPTHSRFYLLEVVRQYASEQLMLATDAADDDASAVRDQHCYYYLTWICQHTADLRGPRQHETIRLIQTELENIRCAWQWAIVRSHVAALAEAAMGLFYVYEMQSLFQEGVNAFAAAAACLDALPEAGMQPNHRRIRGVLLAQQGWFTFHVGRQAEAQTLLEQSLALLRPLNQAADLIFPLNRLAAVTYHAGDYAQSTRLVQEALTLSLAVGDRDGEAVARTILGQIAYLVGAYAEARCHCQESLVVERRLGNRWGMVFTLITLGRVAYALGEYSEARYQFEESLAIRHRMGDTRGIALCLNHLGETAAAQGQHAEAQQLYQESLVLFREIGNLSGAALVLIRLGDTALALDNAPAALQHFRTALQTARQSQAMPHMLAALAGIALVQANTDAELVEALVSLVEQHPAATQETRDRVASLRANSLTTRPGSAHTATQKHHLPQHLDELVDLLL